MEQGTVSEFTILRFGLDPEKISVELKAAPFGIAIQSKFIKRVTMHSVLVLGVFGQKALHRHLSFARKFHVKMTVNQPDQRHWLSNKVCIQHVKNTPLRITVTFTEIDGKACTPFPVPRDLDTEHLSVQTIGERPPKHFGKACA